MWGQVMTEEGYSFVVLDRVPNHVLTSNQQVPANCYCGSYSPFAVTLGKGKDSS